MAKTSSSSGSPPKRRPALSPEAREQQMIGYAMDLVERRLLDGSASSQETTHFLKLATVKAREELEVLRAQKELIVAKKDDIDHRKESRAMFEAAIKAMRTYSGEGDVDDDTNIF